MRWHIRFSDHAAFERVVERVGRPTISRAYILWQVRRYVNRAGLRIGTKRCVDVRLWGQEYPVIIKRTGRENVLIITVLPKGGTVVGHRKKHATSVGDLNPELAKLRGMLTPGSAS